MRFILGFIFFGLLFYALYIYFPDAFQTLVSWAADIFNAIRNWIQQLSGKRQTAPSPTPQTLFILQEFI